MRENGEVACFLTEIQFVLVNNVHVAAAVTHVSCGLPTVINVSSENNKIRTAKCGHVVVIIRIMAGMQSHCDVGGYIIYLRSV